MLGSLYQITSKVVSFGADRLLGKAEPVPVSRTQPDYLTADDELRISVAMFVRDCKAGLHPNVEPLERALVKTRVHTTSARVQSLIDAVQTPGS